MGGVALTGGIVSVVGAASMVDRTGVATPRPSCNAVRGSDGGVGTLFVVGSVLRAAGVVARLSVP